MPVPIHANRRENTVKQLKNRANKQQAEQT